MRHYSFVIPREDCVLSGSCSAIAYGYPTFPKWLDARFRTDEGLDQTEIV